MMDVEKLIEQVRKFPVLYDQWSEKYRHPEYKEKIWKIIAKNLEVEGGVEECKTRWNSVRDQLRRTLQKRKTKSGPVRKYKYEDELRFLVPHLGERGKLPNATKEQVDTEETNDDSQEDLIKKPSDQCPVDEKLVTQDDSVPDARRDYGFTEQIFENTNNFSRPKAIKRRISGSEQIQEHTSSFQLITYILAEKAAEKHAFAVDAFLSGIAPSLKSLNPHFWNEAKGKLFAVVQEMEMKQLNANSEGNLMPNHLIISSPCTPASSTYDSPNEGTIEDPLCYNF